MARLKLVNVFSENGIFFGVDFDGDNMYQIKGEDKWVDCPHWKALGFILDTAAKSPSTANRRVFSTRYCLKNQAAVIAQKKSTGRKDLISSLLLEIHFSCYSYDSNLDFTNML